MVELADTLTELQIGPFHNNWGRQSFSTIGVASRFQQAGYALALDILPCMKFKSDLYFVLKIIAVFFIIFLKRLYW